MSSIEARAPFREVRMRIMYCFFLILLSVDELNPIKNLCEVCGFKSGWIALAAAATASWIIYANAKELAYFGTKVFFYSIFQIFFRTIEVLGKQNIPEHGPIIFCGNHNNQFVDGAVMVVTNPHRVGFLVAEKSFNQRIIGDFSKAVGSIPVARPQDYAKRGPGKIMFDGLRLRGQGTLLTKLQKGDKIRPGKSAEAYRVKNVISDTEAELVEDKGESSPLQEAQAQGVWVEYDILAAIDQGKMFEKVHAALAEGRCLGIFPEGGSHDKTDLLPLKAGIASIAFGVYEKYGKSVPIVPVGLNYLNFKGHRFRSRVVVEFGQPIHIDKQLANLYKDSKRDAYTELLTQVEDGMRSVLVTASSYGELKLIHTFRRLYQGSHYHTTTTQKQDLARRFAMAFRLIKEKFGDNLPEDLASLKSKLEAYQKTLDRWGLKDYQVDGCTQDIKYSKALYTFVHGAVIVSLASIPSLILNAPVGYAAKLWAHSQAQKDLKASRVKVKGVDVLMSKKILFSIVAVPSLWLFYALLLWYFSPFDARTIVILLLCCPVFSYIGVMAIEAGMVDAKDLRPLFLRLLPGYRQQCKDLPALRAALQVEVRQLCRKYGPEFGSLYYEKSNAWEKSARRMLRSTSEDALVGFEGLVDRRQGGDEASAPGSNDKNATKKNK